MVHDKSKVGIICWVKNQNYLLSNYCIFFFSYEWDRVKDPRSWNGTLSERKSNWYPVCWISMMRVSADSQPCEKFNFLFTHHQYYEGCKCQFFFYDRLQFVLSVLKHISFCRSVLLQLYLLMSATITIQYLYVSTWYQYLYAQPWVNKHNIFVRAWVRTK